MAASPPTHAEAWRTNLNGRTKEVRDSIENVLSCIWLARDANEKEKAKFAESIQNLTAQVESLTRFFDPNKIPDPVAKLSGAAANLGGNPNHAGFIKKLCNLHDALKDLGAEQTTFRFRKFMIPSRTTNLFLS